MASTFMIKKARKELIAGYGFLLPNFLGFIIFTLFPVSASLVLSFFKWNLAAPPTFTGLNNYVELLTRDPFFWAVIRNTLYYALLVIPVGMTISLILALALNQALLGRLVYRFIFFLPVVISLIAVSMVWYWLYDADFGIINYFLWTLFRIQPIYWLNEPSIAMISVAVVAIWHGSGYNMVIIMAGLQGIPRQLYEAADIDGANTWRKFLNVTLPMLSPTLFFILVMAIINSFQVFDLVFSMTGGGPMNSTRTIVTYIYENGFSYFRMGYASAIAWVLFAVIFIATFIQFRFQKDWVQYYG